MDDDQLESNLKFLQTFFQDKATKILRDISDPHLRNTQEFLYLNAVCEDINRYLQKVRQNSKGFKHEEQENLLIGKLNFAVNSIKKSSAVTFFGLWQLFYCFETLNLTLQSLLKTAATFKGNLLLV